MTGIPNHLLQMQTFAIVFVLRYYKSEYNFGFYSYFCFVEYLVVNKIDLYHENFTIITIAAFTFYMGMQ